MTAELQYRISAMYHMSLWRLENEPNTGARLECYGDEPTDRLDRLVFYTDGSGKHLEKLYLSADYALHVFTGSEQHIDFVKTLKQCMAVATKNGSRDFQIAANVAARCGRDADSIDITVRRTRR